MVLLWMSQQRISRQSENHGHSKLGPGCLVGKTTDQKEGCTERSCCLTLDIGIDTLSKREQRPQTNSMASADDVARALIGGLGDVVQAF